MLINVKSKLRTELTFVIEEEREEADEHERLEVVHGVDRVLEAWTRREDLRGGKVSS